MGYRTLNKQSKLLIAFLLITGNVIAAHFFPPIGLLISPVAVVVAVVIVNTGSALSDIYFKAITAFAFIAVNDIGIKLYAGGIHDSEGQGLVNLLLIAGALISLPILIFSVTNTSNISIFNKVFSVLIFLILTGLYISFFSDLGLSRSYL